MRRARARLVVRACADTRARKNKGAGGPEGARARVDMAAQVAISGGRADSGVAGEREPTGVTICSCCVVCWKSGLAMRVRCR